MSFLAMVEITVLSEVSGVVHSKQKMPQAYDGYGVIDIHGDYPKSDISTSESLPEGPDGHKG